MNPPLLDAHTHLDLYTPEELAAAMAQIAERRVLTVAMAVDPDSYARTRAIAAGQPLVIPCFGVHPWEAHRFAHDLAALQPLMAASPLLGEIGLDYLLDDNPDHYPAQRAVFAAFLQHAAAEDKIVSLHTKGAEHDVLAMLDQYAVPRAVLHWYSGPRDLFDALAARGCWFSFGVAVPHDPAVQALARAVPLDRLLTETDSPGALRHHTGEAGMPLHLRDVLQTIAGLRGLGVAELQMIVADNWRRLVGGDPRLDPWAGW
jgi:TatD DNase family protein